MGPSVMLVDPIWDRVIKRPSSLLQFFNKKWSTEQHKKLCVIQMPFIPHQNKIRDFGNLIFDIRIWEAFFLCRDLFSPFIIILFPPFPPPLLVVNKDGILFVLRRKRRKKKKQEDKYKHKFQQIMWSKDTVPLSFGILHRYDPLSAAGPEPRSISGCCWDCLKAGDLPWTSPFFLNNNAFSPLSPHQISHWTLCHSPTQVRPHLTPNQHHSH